MTSFEIIDFKFLYTFIVGILQLLQYKMSSITPLKLVTYSDKAIAVFGDVTRFEHALRSLGGMFNERLTHEGEKKAGFIFSKFSYKQVAAFVANPKENVPTQIYNKSEKKENVKEDITDDKIMLSREQFMNLVSSVTRLEQDVAMLKKKLDISSSEPKNSTIIKNKKIEKPKETKSSDEDSEVSDHNESENTESIEDDDDQEVGPSLMLAKKPTRPQTAQPKTIQNETGFKSLLMSKKR